MMKNDDERQDDKGSYLFFRRKSMISRKKQYVNFDLRLHIHHTLGFNNPSDSILFFSVTKYKI